MIGSEALWARQTPPVRLLRPAGRPWSADPPGAPPEISGAERRPGGNGMFERFSDRARRVVVLAQEEARMLNQNYIGTEQSAPTGHIPFTPRAKKVLELSLREALHLGHNYIGTEHILPGLIHEGEGVAAQVFQKLGADLNRV